MLRLVGDQGLSMPVLCFAPPCRACDEQLTSTAMVKSCHVGAGRSSCSLAQSLAECLAPGLTLALSSSPRRARRWAGRLTVDDSDLLACDPPILSAYRTRGIWTAQLQCYMVDELYRQSPLRRGRGRIEVLYLDMLGSWRVPTSTTRGILIQLSL
ncbi:hypothetical protein EXIGLDRAFT_309118 [Exidia glandulosa HHB12029]|uniref:Uncharacterized protein n=1 Tax=Exidia glandulosa HHB12029 TaxID=1314781 RepID=A0A165D159_EXIGL|nr:hypothetical protein EXIGLDRAFT_309118 [Exidia glandulosa HHB12029]